jgi:hypothetical protein
MLHYNDISMDLIEVITKSALVRSRIPGVQYVINPYTGCGHGCRYCYAVFMRKYSKHHQAAAWGSFVEAKTNIVDVLRNELSRKRKIGTAMLSSVCDPYQPAERKYGLTRGCIEALREHGWGINILTRSPLVTRDIDLLKTCIDASVGFSIPTDDDRVRAILEPASPPIARRIEALQEVHAAGIHTWGGRRDMSVIDCVDRWAGRACGFRAGRAELINGVSLIAVPYRLELFRARLSVCASGLRSVKRSSAIAHFSDSVCYFAAGPSSTSQAGLPMPLYRFTGNGR